MNQGFTLIEVLLATLLSSILGTILFFSYYQSNKTTTTIDRLIDFYERELLLQSQLTRDISGTFIPGHALDKEHPIEDVFVSKNSDQMTTFLTFISNNPLPSYESSKPLITRITYRLEEDSHSSAYKKSYRLVRQESPYQDALSKATGERGAVPAEKRFFEVVSGIKTWRISYKKKKKVEQNVTIATEETWNSLVEKKETSSTTKSSPVLLLPDVVIIEVTLWDTSKQRSKEIQIHIPLIEQEPASKEEKALTTSSTTESKVTQKNQTTSQQPKTNTKTAVQTHQKKPLITQGIAT